MNAKICDRCGKTFIPNYDELNTKRCRVADTEAHLRYFDLCTECLEDLDEFMGKHRTEGFEYKPKSKKYRGSKSWKRHRDYNLYNSRTETTEEDEEDRDLSLKPRHYKPLHEEPINIEAYESQIRREEDPE